MIYKPGQMWRHKPGEPVKTVMLVEVRRGATPRTTWDRLLVTEEEF